jgi:nicotinamidase-related amidase
MTSEDRYTRPVADSAALVLIDMQRDFLDIPGDDAAMPVAGTGAVISAIAKLARAFRQRGLPIVHVVRLYGPDGSNVDPVRRQSVERGRESPRRAVPVRRSPRNSCPMPLSWTMNCCLPVICNKSELPSM